MEHTNCGCECSFVKSGFCQTDKECPFYVENWWVNDLEPQPRLVKECFPKKFSHEQNALLHRFICMQADFCNLRNKFENLEAILVRLLDVNISQEQAIKNLNLKIDEKESLKQLE